MEQPIKNKVAESGLITLDLEGFLPKDTVVFDLQPHLFMGLILKEKEFRAALKAFDWNSYVGKQVAITCSADAIIPVWAYMLVASYLQPVAASVYVGTEAELKKHLMLQHINAINPQDYSDARVVVKGCGDTPIDAYAYAAVTAKLLPVAKTIMYGEPCSTVPVYKKTAVAVN